MDQSEAHLRSLKPPLCLDGEKTKKTSLQLRPINGSQTFLNFNWSANKNMAMLHTYIKYVCTFTVFRTFTMLSAMYTSMWMFFKVKLITYLTVKSVLRNNGGRETAPETQAGRVVVEDWRRSEGSDLTALFTLMHCSGSDFKTAGSTLMQSFVSKATYGPLPLLNPNHKPIKLKVSHRKPAATSAPEWPELSEADDLIYAFVVLD